MCVFEEEATCSELIEMRGAGLGISPQTTDPIIQVIHGDEEDVWTGLGCTRCRIIGDSVSQRTETGNPYREYQHGKPRIKIHDRVLGSRKWLGFRYEFVIDALGAEHRMYDSAPRFSTKQLLYGSIVPRIVPFRD